MEGQPEQCFMCFESSPSCSTIHEVATLLEDGSYVKPVDVVSKVFDGTIKIAKASKCCLVCTMTLNNFAIIEHSFSKAKSEIFAKLSSLSRLKVEKEELPEKRKKVKPNWFSPNEDEDECEDKITTLQIELSHDKWVEVDQSFEARLALFRDCLKSNVEPSNPGCSFSRINDAKSNCLSKQCDVEVHFELDRDAKCVTVTTRGKSANHGVKDPSRVTFELTKGEFTEECICEFCCEKFNSDELLSQHHKIMNEAVYKCPLCSNESKTFQARNSHFLNVHTSDSPYECKNENCTLSFKTRSKKNQHEKACLYHIRYPCSKCEKTFMTRRNLREHFKIVHDKQITDLPYKCGHCDKQFYKKCNYENHIITHDQTGQKPYVCLSKGCGLSFRRLRTLNDHFKAKHSGLPKTYLCSICGQKFDSNTGYKQHLAKHSGMVYIKRNYACQDCGKTFRSPSDLQIHRVVHTKEKAFACDTCNAQFSQKASLKDHYNVHLKYYVCRVCNKAFGRQRYLDNHAKSCSGLSKETKANEIIIRLEPGQMEEYTIDVPAN